MNQKFSTVNSKVFMNQNAESVPDWMENFADNLKTKEHYMGDWTQEQGRGVFAEYNPTVQRSYADFDANPREITQSFTAQKLKGDAKIALAKFLVGKRYSVQQAVAGTNFASLQVSLDGVPANFIFSFEAKGNKLANASTFLVEPDAEYPFSRAGLEECLADLKTGNLKTNKKAEGIGKAYLINREEIIRRYNGSLRAATTAIDKCLEEGALIGVGSNTYASVYDVDLLFPQQDKDMVERMGEFEFVKNSEHVTTNPYKSAQLLALDATRILSNTFSEVSILASHRDQNELLVKANVLNDRTGTRSVVDFSFAIENEEVSSVRFAEVNEKRLSMAQLVDELSKNGSEVLARYLGQVKTASQRANGIVMTRKDVKQRLYKVVDASKVDTIVDNWIHAGLVQPMNSTTFSTKLTFEELLAHTNTATLSAAKVASINNIERHFGEGLEVDTDEAKPILERIRLVEEAELSDEARMNSFTAYAGRFFKNFAIDNYTNHGEGIYDVAMSFVDGGTRNNIAVRVAFDRSKVVNAGTQINGRYISLNDLAGVFTKDPLLAAYLQDGQSRVAGPIVISETSIRRRLASLVNANDIDGIVGNWKSKYLTSVGENLYASQHTFEELLRNTTAALMTADEMQEIAEIKQFFGDGLHVKADYDKDTGVRTVQVHLTDDMLFQKANARLASEFKHYNPLNFYKDDDNYIFEVELSNEDTGLRHKVAFVLHFDDDKIEACDMLLNGKLVSLASVKKAFALNDALSQYLNQNPGKRHVGPMVMKIAELTRRLTSISSESPEDVVRAWADQSMITYMDSTTVASQHSFEELVQSSNIKALNDEEITERIARSARDRGLMLQAREFVADTGEREIVEGPWSAKRLAIHAQAEIGKIFKDFEILDAQLISGAEPNNILCVTTAFVNPFSGLREKLSFHMGLSEGRPSGHMYFVPGEYSSSVKSVDALGDYLMALAVSNEAVAQFTSIHGSAQRGQRGLISLNSLQNQLRAVVAGEHIADVVDTLVRVNVLKPLNSTTFACDYTMPELVNQLAKLDYVNLSAGQQQLRQAVRDERMVNTSPDYHVKETDTRALTQQAMKVLSDSKDKVLQTLQVAHQAKRITRNKLAQLTVQLQEGQSLHDVQVVINDLKRYL